MIVVENCGGMDLAATLDCGQAFRWQAGPHGWQGIVENRSVTARMEGDTLILEGASETDRDFWVHYFALDMDYPALLAKFSSGNKRLAECVRHKPGIRVLRQPFFETLCTFIISQNNNIPRIRAIVERLCTGLGQPLEGGGFGFPSAQTLAALEPEDLAGGISDRRRPPGGLRPDRRECPARHAHGKRPGRFDDHQGGGAKGGGLRAFVQPFLLEGGAHGCVDEKSHVPAVSPGGAGVLPQPCGHCPAVHLRLCTPPSAQWSKSKIRTKNAGQTSKRELILPPSWVILLAG